MLDRLKKEAGIARTHAGFRRYAANTSWMFFEQMLRMLAGRAPFNQHYFLTRFLLSCLGISTPLSLAQALHPMVLDAQGVQQLLRSKPMGESLFLGSEDPNTSHRFAFDFKARASAMGNGMSKYWRLAASPIQYASGGEGFSARLHLRNDSVEQTFTWKTQQGFLANPTDARNQEFTVYVRVHDLLAPKTAQVSLKIRGGGHHSREPDAASCSFMTFAPAIRKTVSRFGKELTHPIYDYVNLASRVPGALEEGYWVGLKLLSWQDPRHADQVTNQLFIDAGGLDDTGKPANQWQMFSEYVDIDKKSTGKYQTMVNWSGWQTTLRVDGYRTIDFAYPSLREILVPE